jgi:uncharacterized membrane protein YkvA (DUF1232 family)
MSRQASYRPAAGGWSLTSLLRDLGAAWRLLWDPKVPGLLKLALPLFALVYWISPIDLLPGIPLDDLAVVLLAARLFVALAPKESINQAFGGRARPTGGQPPHPEDDANVIDTTWRVLDD